MFGFALKTIREASGMSRNDLALRAKCGSSVIGSIESESTTPSLELTSRLATALGIEPRELMWFFDKGGKATKLNRAVRKLYEAQQGVKQCLSITITN